MVFKNLKWWLLPISVLSVSIIINLLLIVVAIIILESNYDLKDGLNNVETYSLYSLLFAALINGIANYLYSKNYKLLKAAISVILTLILSVFILFVVRGKFDIFNELESPCYYKVDPSYCGD
jgi:drug/metabolite transporter (DMT)-like permease